MTSVFARRALGIISIILILPQFQNCAPSNVSYSEAPPEPQAAATSEPATAGDAILRGTVSNALTNAALANVIVRVRKAETPTDVVASLTSGSAGTFQSAALAPGNYLVDFVLANFIPVSNVPLVITAGKESVLNQSLSTAIGNDQIRIVLNWCDPKAGAAEDVDAYLSYPGGADPIYFNSPNGDGVKLDIDILKWRGPETVTISTVKTGTYSYYVNNYSNRDDSAALGRSEVKVAVYKGSQQLKLYTVPAGAGISYEVFRIVNGSIVDIKRYDASLRVAW